MNHISRIEIKNNNNNESIKMVNLMIYLNFSAFSIQINMNLYILIEMISNIKLNFRFLLIFNQVFRVQIIYLLNKF